MCKAGADQPSTVAVSLPTVPFMDGSLMKHHHNFLIKFLPGIDPTLSPSQGSLIATNIGEVMVEI